MATSKVTEHPSARQAANSMRTEDMALVERCRAGDLAAFEELYAAHAGKLFSVACRMLGNQSDAEDILQEIFLSAHRKLDGFRGDVGARHVAVPAGDEPVPRPSEEPVARTNQLTDVLDDEPALYEAGGGGLAEQTVTKMDIERALAQLPAGCRAAFVLHDVEGLEHREVADALGIAEGTSKSQVHKARLRLRALLGARGRAT